MDGGKKSGEIFPFPPLPNDRSAAASWLWPPSSGAGKASRSRVTQVMPTLPPCLEADLERVPQKLWAVGIRDGGAPKCTGDARLASPLQNTHFWTVRNVWFTGDREAARNRSNSAFSYFSGPFQSPSRWDSVLSTFKIPTSLRWESDPFSPLCSPNSEKSWAKSQRIRPV